MGPSAFQFSNPVLLQMNIEVNRGFSPENAIMPKVAFNVEVNRHMENREAIVELTVSIGETGDEYPFSISMTEGAKFKWSEEADDKLEFLLNQNAPALLLGYIRPIVATVTAASPFGAYNIPFIDFTKTNTDHEE